MRTRRPISENPTPLEVVHHIDDLHGCVDDNSAKVDDALTKYARLAETVQRDRRRSADVAQVMERQIARLSERTGLLLRHFDLMDEAGQLREPGARPPLGLHLGRRVELIAAVLALLEGARLIHDLWGAVVPVLLAP